MFGANRAPILRQYYRYLQTDGNELSVEPRHLGVPTGASKMISDPLVQLVQTMHLSCTDAKQRLRMDQNKIPHDPRRLGVPSGVSKMISEPMVRSAQTVHPSCVNITTISKRTEIVFQLSLITWQYHRFRPKRYLSLWYG